jgi:inner membrane protein
MFELFLKVKIHTVQYLLVGAAMVLFYLLLLSLSEQLSFSPAYVLASIVTIGLVGSYSRSVLRHRAGVIIIALSLSMLYGFFFTLLQEQELSLLLGSIGLTVVLGGVMYLTRNLDWFALGDNGETTLDNRYSSTLS